MIPNMLTNIYIPDSHLFLSQLRIGDNNYFEAEDFPKALEKCFLSASNYLGTFSQYHRFHNNTNGCDLKPDSARFYNITI